MAQEMEKRSAYAKAVIAAGDRLRKERDAADAECREAFKTANDRFRQRMDQAMHVYDEELKAARIEYKGEEDE